MMETSPFLSIGEPLESARAAVILVHGRGASAQSLEPLVRELAVPQTAFLLPQAPGGSWYPYTFLSSLEANEPWLSKSLAQLGTLTGHLRAAGIEPHRIILGGFSQGACLALEFVARRAPEHSWGGVFGFSGGLIGPPGAPRSDHGQLNSMPVFLGCSDIDPHIPKARVEETAQVFQQLGAQVTMRLYRGMGHTVNEEEIAFARQIISLQPGEPNWRRGI